jgi:hypothetical protein
LILHIVKKLIVAKPNAYLGQNHQNHEKSRQIKENFKILKKKILKKKKKKKKNFKKKKKK